MARRMGAHRARQRERLGRRSRTTARREDGGWVLDGTKMFITQGSVGGFCVVLARTNRSRAEATGITAFVVEHGTPGFTAASTCSSSAAARATPSSSRSRTCVSRTRSASARSIAASSTRCGSSTAGASRSPRWRSASATARSRWRSLREGAQGVRQAHRGVPGHPVDAADAKTELDAAAAPHVPRGVARRPGQRHTTEASMAKLFASEAATRACNKRAADPRRLRLHARVRRRASPARREALRDWRGHERSAAHGDRQARACRVINERSCRARERRRRFRRPRAAAR